MCVCVCDSLLLFRVCVCLCCSTVCSPPVHVFSGACVHFRVRACELVCLCWAGVTVDWLNQSTLTVELIITIPGLMLMEKPLGGGDATTLWDSVGEDREIDELDRGTMDDQYHEQSMKAAAAEMRAAMQQWL